MSATERGRILHRMSVLMLGRAEELAQTEARDTGKPLTQARNDIQVAARYFEYYGAAADKLHGEVIPYQEDFHVAVLHEPYGVTAHILPWSYPAQMFGRSIAPALATGNAPVLKPAEDACLTPLAFCDIANEAGLPAGALNVVTGLGEEAGAALVAHAGVRLITFTGSPEVGAQVQKAAGERLVKCVLELGGKSPQIVFEDADLDGAAGFVLKAITQNAGQTCSAGSRLLVQASIHERSVQKVASLLRAVGGRHAGDGPRLRPADQCETEAARGRLHAGGARERRAAAEQGMAQLNQKVAIVTGAAGGFGEGIARAHVAEGARVIVADLNGPAAAHVAQELGAQASPFTCDVSNGPQVQALVTHCMRTFGVPDIVVNNAGTTHRNQPMLQVDEASFDRVFAVNVKSIYHMTQAVLPLLRQRGCGGVILNIGSTAGIRPRPGLRGCEEIRHARSSRPNAPTHRCKCSP